MFVSYSRKGDATYARLVTSRRVDGRVVKETSKRNQKCKVYDSKVITCEPTSAANELYRAIGATCLVEIPLPCGKKQGRELRIITVPAT